jgi:hypothetical protein
MKTIGYRIWNPLTKTVFYVAQVKGDGGADWGYTTEPAKACHLSPYWVRRFNADCRYCGTVAQFLTI